MASRTSAGKTNATDIGAGPREGEAARSASRSERRVNDGRHIYGPRAVGAIIPGVVRPVYKRRSPATAQILMDWEAIVGPAIAAVTTPRKLFSGTLSIVCPGPVALELQHLADGLMARINGHLGRIAVTRLRFIQDIVPAPPPPRPPPRLAVDAAAAAVASLPPGDLRDAMERLGRVVLTERTR